MLSVASHAVGRGSRCRPRVMLSVAGHPKTVRYLKRISHLHVLKAFMLHFVAQKQRQTDGRYGLLVSGLKETLGTCPALPSEILSTLLEDCLRRPSSAVAWSMRAAPLLVRGALSLLTQSPRSLCRAVLPVLVCFVAESECGVPGK